MPSSRHALLPLLLAAAMGAALAVFSSGGATAPSSSEQLMIMPTIHHARVAAEWSRSDDDSCWGSPEECPVYDVDAEGSGGGATPRGRRMGLELYYDDVNSAAASPSLQPTSTSQTPPCISYSALRRDSVPCSVPGASYYNCQPGGDANPYTRGCSAITQCRE